jgi:hypothetical protein
MREQVTHGIQGPERHMLRALLRVPAGYNEVPMREVAFEVFGPGRRSANIDSLFTAAPFLQALPVTHYERP